MICKTINNELLMEKDMARKFLLKTGRRIWFVGLQKIDCDEERFGYRWVHLGKLPFLFSTRTVNPVILHKRRLKNSKPLTDRSVIPSAIHNSHVNKAKVPEFRALMVINSRYGSGGMLKTCRLLLYRVVKRTHPWTHYLPIGLEHLPAATAHTNTRL
jgi:hypothetical protein